MHGKRKQYTQFLPNFMMKLSTQQIPFLLQLKLLTAALLFVLAFLSCSDKKENNPVFFPEPPKEKLDSVCTWLSKPKNYSKDTYFAYFEKHFKEQIAHNNLDSAARLLYHAGYVYQKKDIYDTIVVQKYLDFLSKYENQIKLRFRSGLYRMLAKMCRLHSEYEKAITYLRKNNFTPEDYYSADNLAWSFYELSYSFSQIAQYDSTILYGQKAMVLFEKQQEPYGLFAVNGSLTSAYGNMQNYQEAEKYARKSLEFARVGGDSGTIFRSMYNLLDSYREAKSPLLSSTVDTLVNFEKEWQDKDTNCIFMVQSALAYRYVMDSNYVETNKILERIAPLFPIVNDAYFSQFYVFALAESEIAQHKPLSLKKLHLERLQQAKTTNAVGNMLLYNDFLSREAAALNDHKTAYKYLQDMVIANERLRNNKIRYESSELQTKYETEKKEAQLKIQAADASKKNVFIAFLGLGLAALFYFYSLMRKKNTVIAQQNELNEQTITVLSHDIKEPLLGVKLLLKKLNKDDPFIAQASQSLTDQINAVNGILTNLLKMKKLGLTKRDKNAQADVSTVVQNVVQELSTAIEAKELTVHTELSDTMRLPIAPEKLQIIVHNLLSNAVKYSFPQQQIRIVKEGKGFSIQDFGVGLSPEQRSKLMREVTASERGTQQERGNGLGLFLVGSLLQGETIKVIFDSPEIGGTIAKILE